MLDAGGQPLSRAFLSREQADDFADMTGAADRLDVPVLWLPTGRRYDHMPLFGIGHATMWASPFTTTAAAAEAQKS